MRERSGKKPGGQKGHKGETLRQVTDPNEGVNHYPPACSMCGVGLDPKTSVALMKLEQSFADDEACRQYLFGLRWRQGFEYSACGGRGVWKGSMPSPLTSYNVSNTPRPKVLQEL